MWVQPPQSGQGPDFANQNTQPGAVLAGFFSGSIRVVEYCHFDAGDKSFFLEGGHAIPIDTFGRIKAKGCDTFQIQRIQS